MTESSNVSRPSPSRFEYERHEVKATEGKLQITIYGKGNVQIEKTLKIKVGGQDLKNQDLVASIVKKFENSAVIHHMVDEFLAAQAESAKHTVSDPSTAPKLRFVVQEEGFSVGKVDEPSGKMEARTVGTLQGEEIKMKLQANAEVMKAAQKEAVKMAHVYAESTEDLTKMFQGYTPTSVSTALKSVLGDEGTHQLDVDSTYSSVLQDPKHTALRLALREKLVETTAAEKISGQTYSKRDFKRDEKSDALIPFALIPLLTKYIMKMKEKPSSPISTTPSNKPQTPSIVPKGTTDTVSTKATPTPSVSEAQQVILTDVTEQIEHEQAKVAQQVEKPSVATTPSSTEVTKEAVALFFIDKIKICKDINEIDDYFEEIKDPGKIFEQIYAKLESKYFSKKEQENILVFCTRWDALYKDETDQTKYAIFQQAKPSLEKIEQWAKADQQKKTVIEFVEEQGEVLSPSPQNIQVAPIRKTPHVPPPLPLHPESVISPKAQPLCKLKENYEDFSSVLSDIQTGKITGFFSKKKRQEKINLIAQDFATLQKVIANLQDEEAHKDFNAQLSYSMAFQILHAPNVDAQMRLVNFYLDIAEQSLKLNDGLTSRAIYTVLSDDIIRVQCGKKNMDPLATRLDNILHTDVDYSKVSLELTPPVEFQTNLYQTIENQPSIDMRFVHTAKNEYTSIILEEEKNTQLDRLIGLAKTNPTLLQALIKEFEFNVIKAIKDLAEFQNKHINSKYRSTLAYISKEEDMMKNINKCQDLTRIANEIFENIAPQ